MANLILVAGSLLLGLLLRRVPSWPEAGAAGLQAFVIHASLPAVTLLYVPGLRLEPSMLAPFGMALLVVLAGWGLFAGLGRWLGWTRRQVGVLALVAGMGNVSFVGYPVMEALYGEAGLQVAIFVGQGGFLTVSVLGVAMAAAYASPDLSTPDVSTPRVELPWKALGKRLLAFPPFLAFAAALALKGLGWQWPEEMREVLAVLGHTLTPLAMASVGLQWRMRGEAPLGPLSAGLAYKLLLAPLAIWIGYRYWLNDPLLLQVSVMEAGMPPMVTAAMVAAQYKLEPELANALVGWGLLLAAATLPVWNIALG